MKRNNIKDLTKISSYQYDNIFNVYKDTDGYYFYNLYNSLHIDSDISPILYYEHSFTEGDNWINLANTYYGNTKLWWIILITNNIQNPLNLPDPGTKLKILKEEIVSEILNKILTDGS